MLIIYDEVDRLAYWEDFWTSVGRDVDEVQTEDFYPFFPLSKYIRAGERVLEAGCGMGRVVKHFGRRGVRMVGMDYEPVCIKRLGAQDRSLELYVGDVNALPDPPASFDGIAAFGTLSNIEDPRQALAEFRRVLKPGGWMVASVTNDSLLRRILTALQHRRLKTRRFAMMAYTRGEWTRMVEAAGLEVVETTPIVTRLPIWTFLPFLRSSKAKTLEWSVARDGDKGLALNRAGELLFRFAFRFMPFVVSHGVVAVARKPLA